MDIKKLCNDSLTFVKQLAVKKNIQLSLNISGCLINTRLSNIQVDELRIRQVLINLLTNAVKFTPDGGAVVLEVQMGEIQHEGEPSEFYTDFIVSDTGLVSLQRILANCSKPLSKLTAPSIVNMQVQVWDYR